MRMKQVLLASSALAVIAGAQQAQAASDMYVSVFGGANFAQEQSQSFYSGSESYRWDPDTGFVIGGVVGTRLTNWAQGLRVELEAAYRRNDVAGVWTTSTGYTGGFLEGNMSTFSIMANAWYDIDIGSKVRPYIGGGIGWARARSEGVAVETFSYYTPTTFNTRGSAQTEHSGFAWQLGLGFNYEVAPDVDVGIGYRYFVGPNVNDGGEGLFGFIGDDTKIDNENHAVQVNLTIGIN